MKYLAIILSAILLSSCSVNREQLKRNRIENKYNKYRAKAIAYGIVKPSVDSVRLIDSVSYRIQWVKRDTVIEVPLYTVKDTSYVEIRIPRYIDIPTYKSDTISVETDYAKASACIFNGKQKLWINHKDTILSINAVIREWHHLKESYSEKESITKEERTVIENQKKWWDYMFAWLGKLFLTIIVLYMAWLIIKVKIGK